MRNNRQRRWAEQLAVTLVRALNHSKQPRTLLMVSAHMWHTEGQPWSISALANASGLDRASIRDCLNRMPKEHLLRGPDGVTLTAEGSLQVYRSTCAYYRAISNDIRRPLRLYFSAKYAGREPLRKLSAFLLEVDYATRRFPHSLAFRTVLTCLDMMAPRGTAWTIRDMEKETGYSYQACHKAFLELEVSGFARHTDDGYVITRKGQVRGVTYFMLAIRRARPRMLLLLFNISRFHNPPR